MQTQAHVNTLNAVRRHPAGLLLLVLINCIIWTASPSRQCNNNTADKWTRSFNKSYSSSVMLWGPTAGLLTQICSMDMQRDIHHKILPSNKLKMDFVACFSLWCFTGHRCCKCKTFHKTEVNHLADFAWNHKTQRSVFCCCSQTVQC